MLSSTSTYQARVTDPLWEALRPFRLRFALVGLYAALLLATGTVGFVLIEGWSWFRAFYMTVITGTFVGFQEVAPTYNPGPETRFQQGDVMIVLGREEQIRQLRSYVAQGGA